MTTRYQAFNEVTFVAYIKAAIDKSILKERLRKADRNQWEQPYSTLTDAMLYELSQEDAGIDRAENGRKVFYVQGAAVAVYGDKLGQALSFLLPRDREIILLYFFLQAKTEEIAHMMHIDPTTVRRRYKVAIQKLRGFMEDNT